VRLSYGAAAQPVAAAEPAPVTGLPQAHILRPIAVTGSSQDARKNFPAKSMAAGFACAARFCRAKFLITH
jgi:hypothetical protein